MKPLARGVKVVALASKLGEIKLESIVPVVNVESVGEVSRGEYLDDLYGHLISWYLNTRNKYNEVSAYTLNGSEGCSVQDAISFFIGFVMRLSDEDKSAIKDVASGLKEYLISIQSSFIDLLDDAFDWQDSSKVSESDKKSDIQFLWDKISSASDDNNRKLSDVLSAEDYADLKKAFPVVVDAALTCLSKDYAGSYNENAGQYLKDCKNAGKTGVIIGTLINNIKSDDPTIVNPHYAEAYYVSLLLEDSLRQEDMTKLCGIDGADKILIAVYDADGMMLDVSEYSSEEYSNLLYFVRTNIKDYSDEIEYQLMVFDSCFVPYWAKVV